MTNKLQEELHARLREMVDSAAAAMQVESQARGNKTEEGDVTGVERRGEESDRIDDMNQLLVDVFCGQIVRGVRSAANAMGPVQQF
jgi:hypothetical protein